MRDRNLSGRGFLEKSPLPSNVDEFTEEDSGSMRLRQHDQPMKLIPWKDIWITLKVARVRGNGEMIEVFYDTLFKEAVFDDNGAWALNERTRR